MRFSILFFLLFPLVSAGQIFNRFWPATMIEAMRKNPAEVAGMVHGDTLFYYQQTDTGAYFYNLRAQFRLVYKKDNSFKIDVYTKNADLVTEKPNYTNFFTADSIKFKTITQRVGLHDSTLFYPNGVVRIRETKTDTSYAIYTSDSTQENTLSKYFEHDQLIVHTVKKDTVIYGVPGELSFDIRNTDDTIRYLLQDENQRIYTQVNTWKTIHHSIQGSDTMFLETYKGDTNIVSIYRSDSIIIHGNVMITSPYKSCSNRKTGNNIYERYYRGVVTNRIVTEKTKEGSITKSYDVSDGKVYLSSKEEVTPTKRTVTSYKAGKLVSKSISDWDGNGQLLKTTVWHKGEKRVYYPEELVIDNPQCGFRPLPAPYSYNPLVDSVSISISGKKLEYAYYNQLFFRVNDQWMDLELLEDYFVRHYTKSFEQPESGIELRFESNQYKSKFQLKGSYNWKELFGGASKPSAFTYGLQIGDHHPKAEPQELTIYLGLHPQVRSLNKFMDNASERR